MIASCCKCVYVWGGQSESKSERKNLSHMVIKKRRKCNNVDKRASFSFLCLCSLRMGVLSDVCVCASISWRKKKPHARSNREKKTECAWHRTFLPHFSPIYLSNSMSFQVKAVERLCSSVQARLRCLTLIHRTRERERCSQFEDIDSPVTMMLLDYAWEIMRPVTSRAAAYLMW